MQGNDDLYFDTYISICNTLFCSVDGLISLESRDLLIRNLSIQNTDWVMKITGNEDRYNQYTSALQKIHLNARKFYMSKTAVFKHVRGNYKNRKQIYTLIIMIL